MNEKMPLEGTVNHFEKKPEEVLGREEELFNTTVSEMPGLENVYRHLDIDDLEMIALDFHFEMIDFQDFETEEQWDSVDEEMKLLKEYVERRREISASASAEKIDKLQELKSEYRETIESIKNKIQAL